MSTVILIRLCGVNFITFSVKKNRCWQSLANSCTCHLIRKSIILQNWPNQHICTTIYNCNVATYFEENMHFDIFLSKCVKFGALYYSITASTEHFFLVFSLSPWFRSYLLCHSFLGLMYGKLPCFYFRPNMFLSFISVLYGLAFSQIRFSEKNKNITRPWMNEKFAWRHWRVCKPNRN